MLGRPDAARHSRAGRAAGRDQRRPARSWRAPRARCARSAASRTPTPRIATAAAGAPERSRRSRPAWGELFLEKYNNGRGAEVVPDGAAGRPALGAGAARLGARARRREPAAGDQRSRKRALEINPSSVDAHVFLAEQAVDAEPPRRSARGAAEGARRQPVEPRGARAARRRSRTSRTSRRSSRPRSPRRSRSRRSYGEVYRVAGELAGAQLPVRRSGRR